MTPLDQAGERGQLHRAAAALDVPLSALQVGQLLSFRDLLLKWNAVFNLSALREPQTMLNQHLVDCLATVAPLVRVAAERGLGQHGALRILDVGSGAGLPGVVIGIARPDWEVDCLDAVGKKAAFVRQAAAEVGLSGVHGWHGRVESWHRAPQAAGGYDIVTARAFGSLVDLVQQSSGLLRPNGVWAAMKGVPPADEIAALPPQAAVFHVEQLHLPGLQLQRCLVWIEKKPD